MSLDEWQKALLVARPRLPDFHVSSYAGWMTRKIYQRFHLLQTPIGQATMPEQNGRVQLSGWWAVCSSRSVADV